MKKRYFILISLLTFFTFAFTGCTQEEATPITIPDTVIEEEPVEEDTITEEEPIIEDPIAEEPAVTYPYWDEIHDYNADQEVLAADGNIKNLTIQLGNTPEELNITWFSKSGSQGTVNFVSDAGKKLSASVSTNGSISAPGYYRNKATVTGLESNTTYTYQVGNGGTMSPVYSYSTADLYSDNYTFTIVSDQEIGIGDEEDNVLEVHGNAWRLALNRMEEQISDSEFILTLGDQVGRPDNSAQYDKFLDNSVLYSTPLLPVMGNHDVGSGFWGDHFNPPNLSPIGTAQGNDGDYWFVKGNALFMILNTNTSQEKDCHEAFVAETIAKNPDVKWRIVVSHYSPASNVEKYQGTRDSIKYTFSYMAENYDIDLFLGAHDHVYTRSYFLDWECDPLPDQQLTNEFYNPEDPLFIIFSTATGSIYRNPGGYPWAAVSVQNDHPQISKAEVTQNSFTITTYEADSWTEIDSFTIYKD